MSKHIQMIEFVYKIKQIMIVTWWKKFSQTFLSLCIKEYVRDILGVA